jgi:hypothetical protein
MVKTLQAKNLSMYDLEKKFNLTLAEDEQFFTEWRDDLPAITGSKKQALDRIKANYLNLNRRRPMLEDMVKMVVLSPLLVTSKWIAATHVLRRTWRSRPATA